MKVALNATDSAKDLVLGLYGGKSIGTGVTGVSMDIQANGVDLLVKTSTSGAAAAAYFTNNPIDLGSLSGSAYSGGSLDLVAQLKVTTSAIGSGFYTGLLVSG